MSTTASEPPATPPAAPKAKTTEYLILAYDEGAEAWIEGPDVKARSPRKAIESFLEVLKTKDAEEVPTKFIAIPKRYWIVEEPGVETQTRIVWK